MLCSMFKAESRVVVRNDIFEDTVWHCSLNKFSKFDGNGKGLKFSGSWELPFFLMASIFVAFKLEGK